MTENAITLTFGYNNSEQTRQYKITDVEETALPSVKQKVQDFNASQANSDFFVADNYNVSDPQNPIGTFKAIVEAKYEQITTTQIPLN